MGHRKDPVRDAELMTDTALGLVRIAAPQPDGGSPAERRARARLGRDMVTATLRAAYSLRDAYSDGDIGAAELEAGMHRVVLAVAGAALGPAAPHDA